MIGGTPCHPECCCTVRHAFFRAASSVQTRLCCTLLRWEAERDHPWKVYAKKSFITIDLFVRLLPRLIHSRLAGGGEALPSSQARSRREKKVSRNLLSLGQIVTVATQVKIQIKLLEYF